MPESDNSTGNRDHPSMSIGQLAEQAGRRPSSIRYYESIGLLPAPERVAGQRRYGQDALRLLAMIDAAQRAGLSLDEIRELVEHGSAPMSERLREVAERRLPEIDALIDRAQRVRTWLETATACDCQSIDECALFDDAALAAVAGGRRTAVVSVGPAP